MRVRPIWLSLLMIGLFGLVGCLLWWGGRNLSAQTTRDLAAPLVGARTAISAGRPVWICTYEDAGSEFNRTRLVTSGVCPNTARR